MRLKGDSNMKRIGGFKRYCLCTLSLILLCVATNALGQTTFGSITGVVTDPTGAVVPGATVTATDKDTGFTRRAGTAGNGVYTVSKLPVGTYTVRIEATGFATQDRPGVVLDANHVVNVDVKLTVGATATHVEVQGVVPLINTETGTSAYTQTSLELQNLPLTVRQGNTNQSFALYNPGVGVNDSGNYFGPGARQVDMYWTNDGIVEMQDIDGSGGSPAEPDIESISEINYTLVNASAEFRSPTSVTMVTKSGTNQYHGSAYYDYNGNALNARDFFSSKVPFAVYNDFAASVGGPIKKNKTFFFADYEGSRSSARSIVTANAPLPAWRTGDFSSVSKQLINPFTGAPFTNNQIDPGLINPVSQKLMNFLYPLPNYGPSTLLAGNWRGLFPTSTDFNVVDGRIDHNFSERDTIFGRYNYRRLPNLIHRNMLPPAGDYPQLRTDSDAVISYTHTFSPVVLNEFRAGFSRDTNYVHAALIGSDVISQVGLQGISTTGIPGLPIISVTGITNDSYRSYHKKALTNYELNDDLSWTHGAHAFKFGADYIFDQINQNYLPDNLYGSYQFTGKFTGSPFADFLLGLPHTTSLNVPTPSIYLRGNWWSFYAQDQYKVTRRLSLNYGIRWELQQPYRDKFGRIFSYNPATGALVVPQQGLQYINPLFPSNVAIVSAQQAGFPADTLLDFHKAAFYPRFGFAYKLTADGKTVIRGGYGWYSNAIYGTLARSSGGGPFGGSESFFNSITNGVPLFSFPNPFVPAAGQVSAFQNASGINPHTNIPYTQQWNLTLERQIKTFGISVAYVGTHSVRLLYPANINQPMPSTQPFSISELPNPSFDNVSWIDNGSTEKYNALMLSATKNAGKNLTFGAGYTYARDLTDQLDQDWSFGQTIQNLFDRSAEWGNNYFTPWHRFYAHFIYSLPFGRQQSFFNRMPRFADAVLGGWRISSVITLQSGQWYNPTFDGYDPSNTNNFGGRPDAIASVSPVPSGGPTVDNWFNIAAFKIPGCPDNDPLCSNATPANIGRFGNAGNDTLATPAMKNVDLALMKRFNFEGNRSLTFQAVFSDALNHPNFGYPDADISDGPGVAGVISSTLGNYLGGSNTSRQINLALRLEF
jgi:Carboxypeptidase regulatory-like domain